MANDLNQCNFIGRLGGDPEIRYRPEGGAVCSFSIAVGWKTKDKEGTEWVRIVTYDRLAEICGEYLRKGSKVFLSGRFKTRKYTDKDGIDRYTTEIVCDELQMLDGAPQQASAQNQGYQQPQQGYQVPTNNAYQHQHQAYQPPPAAPGPRSNTGQRPHYTRK